MNGAPARASAVARVRFRFDGRAFEAPAGQSVAAALLAAGVTALRRAPVDDSPRGGLCWMGICQECAVRVDGVRVEACRLTVSDGLEVERA